LLVLIIFPLILQTITTAQMWCNGGEGQIREHKVQNNTPGSRLT